MCNEGHAKMSYRERKKSPRKIRLIKKGLTGYSSFGKMKALNLYRVCADFWIINDKLVKINPAFQLVRDWF